MALCNPYLLSAAGFIFAYLLFALRLSGLYPAPTFSVFIFIFVFVLLAVLLGISFNKIIKHPLSQSKKEELKPNTKRFTITYFGLLLFFLIELGYNQKIPLLEAIKGSKYNYQDFSFPLLHILFTSFTSFFSVLCFFVYLKSKNKRYLVYLSLIHI